MIKLHFKKRTTKHFAVRSSLGQYLRLGKKGVCWVYDINEATLFTNANTAYLTGIHKNKWKCSIEVIKVELKILAVDKV